MQTEVHIVSAILQQNEFLLKRHLVLSPTVLDKMKGDGVITDAAKRKISTAPAVRQVPVLLNVLESSGLHNLQKFLDVLRATGHSWLVDKILDTDVSHGRQRSAESFADSLDERHHGSGRYTRPIPTHFPGYVTSPRRRTVMFDPTTLRKTATAGPTTHAYDGGGMTLADILRARALKEEPEIAPPARGVYHARSLLTDPTILRHQTTLPTLSPYGASGGFPAMPNSKDEIPMTLYALNEAFADQDNQNQQVLGVLRQEALAIHQLLDQNARDQGNVRRKQAAVNDIVTRLRDIHHRAKDVYQPAPHPNIGRYRLSQLNQIPWSIDK